MIISEGYCIKGQNGIVFRWWTNKILKDYIIKAIAVEVLGEETGSVWLEPVTDENIIN